MGEAVSGIAQRATTDWSRCVAYFDVPGAAMAMGQKLSKRTAGPGSMAHAAAPKLPGSRGLAMPAPIAPIAGLSAGPQIAPRGIIGGSMKTGLANPGDLTSKGGQPNV